MSGAAHGWPNSKRVNQMFYLIRANIWRQLWVFSGCWGHPSIAPGLISRLGYGGKVSDFVVAVLQVTCSSSWNNPAKPAAVWPGALGGGIFSQAFPNQLPHTNQVTISNLHRWGGGVLKLHNCDVFTMMVTNVFHTGQYNIKYKGIKRIIRSAASADFPESLQLCHRLQGRAVPWPHSTTEPWRVEMAAEKQYKLFITKPRNSLQIKTEKKKKTTTTTANHKSFL